MIKNKIGKNILSTVTPQTKSIYFYGIMAIMILLLMPAGHANAQGGAGVPAGLAGAAGIAAGANSTVLGSKDAALCAGNDYGACFTAAFHFITADVSIRGAKAAFTTKMQVEGGGGGPGTPDDWGIVPEGNTPNVDYGPYGNTAGIHKAIDDGLKTLKDKGFVIDKNKQTITDVAGKSHPLSSLSSGAAMLKEGLIGSDDVVKIDDSLKKSSDKLRVVSMGLVGGGGGGGSGSRASSYVYEDPYAAFKTPHEKPSAPKTDGLTRTLASGESIGSQTDNIFNMIRRRYDQKKTENIFVTESHK